MNYLGGISLNSPDASPRGVLVYTLMIGAFCSGVYYCHRYIVYDMPAKDALKSLDLSPSEYNQMWKMFREDPELFAKQIAKAQKSGNKADLFNFSKTLPDSNTATTQTSAVDGSDAVNSRPRSGSISDALIQFEPVNIVNDFNALYICVVIVLVVSVSFFTFELYLMKQVYYFIRSLVDSTLIRFTKKHFLFIFFLTVILFMINLGGTSLYSFSSSSYISITLLLSIIVNYLAGKLAVIFQKWYFLQHFMPNGSPRDIGLLLVFIEKVSFSSRILSLAVRLFANITAGHILLKILSGFSIIFLFAFSIYIFLIILPNIIITSLTALETAIATLQTYVFISLTVLYIGQAYGGH